MISEDLRKLIEPYLRLHLHDDDKKYIDDMFTEAYITYSGRPKITLKPHPNADTICMQFSPINGAFLGIFPDWEYIKSVGTKL